MGKGRGALSALPSVEQTKVCEVEGDVLWSLTAENSSKVFEDFFEK
jgi:hypothetical protein